MQQIYEVVIGLKRKDAEPEVIIDTKLYAKDEADARFRAGRMTAASKFSPDELEVLIRPFRGM